MERVKALIAGIGAARVAIMGAVAVALLGALAWIATGSGGGAQGYLFTDLDPATARAITQKLDAAGVKYSLSPDGTAILAPQSRLAELRMSMASENLSGPIGYELLDKQQPFGLSSARESLDATRALEGELARSIMTLRAVESARVHIVTADKPLFGTADHKASAAVSLRTRGRLSGENVAAIRALVSASVADLSPDAVSVIDQNGHLLARAGSGTVGGGDDADERELAIEDRVRGDVEALLTPIVGEGKVRAEVSATVDRAETREESHAFDPDKQVVAHTITVTGDNRSQSSESGGGPVSVSTQLPGGQVASGAGGGPTSTSADTSNSEDTTYDNSRTDTVRVNGPGTLKHLSVAVMVDGGKAGMPAAQLQRLKGLVQAAVGYDAARGDVVTVEQMPFAVTNDPGVAESLMDMVPAGAVLSIVKLLLVAGVGLFVLRLIRSGSVTDGAGAAATADGGTLVPGQPAGALPAASSMAQLDHDIALAQVEGNIKASSLTRISEAIAASPAESASVIRKWMNT